jgi:guanosine-3',5'-bis(diphosphate) 3'-pyrophosphohydrolase
VEESGFKEMDDLLEDIGLGNQMAQIAARRLLPPDDEQVQAVQAKPLATPIIIRGTEGLVINIAKCCRPIPGDSIIGHLSAGRGMVIHRDNCRNINQEMKQSADKCLAVEWAPDVTGEFSVDLRLEIANQRGMLAAVATSLAEGGVNIEHINLKEKDPHMSQVSLRIAVTDRQQLARAIRRLRATEGVIKLVRVKH